MLGVSPVCRLRSASCSTYEVILSSGAHLQECVLGCVHCPYSGSCTAKGGQTGAYAAPMLTILSAFTAAAHRIRAPGFSEGLEERGSPTTKPSDLIKRQPPTLLHCNIHNNPAFQRDNVYTPETRGHDRLHVEHKKHFRASSERQEQSRSCSPLDSG